MRFDRILFLFIGFAAPGAVSAQSEMEVLMERLSEFMTEEQAEDFDLSALAERLEFYERNPIDLNRTDGTELLEFPFIPQLFIENLLVHRNRSGRFVSLYELQAIEGIDEELLRLLWPYITVDAPRSLAGIKSRQLREDGSHEVMVRYGRTLEQRRGYTITDTTRSRYLGTPDQVLVRYRYHFGKDLQVSFNMKKDAGETFWGPNGRGFDFYSGSLYIRNQGRLKDWVVGDYSLQLGQGLAMWTGLGFGKGSMVHNMARQSVGVRPYTSTNETSFLRGAAATVSFGNFLITPFFSRRRLDGSVEEAEGQERVAGSVNQSGLHRTPTELANRGALSQYVLGLDARYGYKHLRLGATAFYTGFDAAIDPQHLLRNQYAFRGNELWNTSVSYTYSWRGMYLYGEAAHSLGSGYALANGLIASLHPHFSMALHHRDYQRNYHSFFNQGVAEGSMAANERGFYAGVVYHPRRSLEWVLYGDFFRFPWLRYRVDAPSRGVDMFSQLTYTWHKKASLSLRYRFRQHGENASFETPYNRIVDVLRQQMRINGQYKLNDAWTLRGRIEGVHYRKEGEAIEMGWMVYQDFLYHPMAGKLSGNFRMAWFSTPGYNSRIYAFENDVLYGYSFPAYHNTGLRSYVNFRWRLWRKTDLWLRYATFIYRNVEEIGSGLDAIDGNHRSDIRVQLRWQF